MYQGKIRGIRDEGRHYLVGKEFDLDQGYQDPSEKRAMTRRAREHLRDDARFPELEEDAFNVPVVVVSEISWHTAGFQPIFVVSRLAFAVGLIGRTLPTGSEHWAGLEQGLVAVRFNKDTIIAPRRNLRRNR